MDILHLLDGEMISYDSIALTCFETSFSTVICFMFYIQNSENFTYLLFSLLTIWTGYGRILRIRFVTFNLSISILILCES